MGQHGRDRTGMEDTRGKGVLDAERDDLPAPEEEARFGGTERRVQQEDAEQWGPNERRDPPWEYSVKANG